MQSYYKKKFKQKNSIITAVFFQEANISHREKKHCLLFRFNISVEKKRTKMDRENIFFKYIVLL